MQQTATMKNLSNDFNWLESVDIKHDDFKISYGNVVDAF